MYRLATNFLHSLPPETAHHLSIKLLRYGPAKNVIADLDLSCLSQQYFNRTFLHPLGLAAGFDKDAQVFDKLGLLGFSFVEIGSVTPKPQPGNPKPRVFRLKDDSAIINRYGFNSLGIDFVDQQFNEIKKTCVTGINLGKNKTTENDAEDFLLGTKKLARHADYLTINVSSPNTPGLRDLQNPEFLRVLIKEVRQIISNEHTSQLTPPPDLPPQGGEGPNKLVITGELLLNSFLSCREQLQGPSPPPGKHLLGPSPPCGGRSGGGVNSTPIPLFIKLSPDMDIQTETQLIECLSEENIDGIIISNTTVQRSNVNSKEAGGLSGPPLFDLSTQMLRRAFQITKGKTVLIGCGGISSGKDAYKKLKAGANLLQLYTAFIYQGPHVLRRVITELVELLHRDGVKNIKEIIGISIK